MEPTTTPDYPRGITFEEVWASIKELRESQKETDRMLKETERIMKENAERQREETDRIAKENAERQKEIDRQMKETDRQMKETDRKIGDLGNRFGELAEHLVAPGIVERFMELGFHFKITAYSKYGPYDGYKVVEGGKVRAEIDIMLEDGNCMVAVEVKTRPVEKDIEHHIRRLEILREQKDGFGDKRKIRGAMAGAVFPEDVKEAALEAGFYVLVQSGDTMKIDIPQNFVPREW